MRKQERKRKKKQYLINRFLYSDFTIRVLLFNLINYDARWFIFHQINRRYVKKIEKNTIPFGKDAKQKKSVEYVQLHNI